MPSRLFGLIAAAGSGTRFGGGSHGAPPKQYADIGGRPLLWHAINALLADRRIETVFVALSPEDERFRQCDCSAFGARLAPLYCGGATRKESVLNGLIAASSAIDLDDWVLVHDAARPCLAKDDLARLIETLMDDEVGGILATPVADTVKRGDAGGRIVSTERRESLWLAQTPQMFRHGTLIRAMERAGAITDEAAAVEALGLKPKLVAGAISNFKVTYPGDLALARTLLGVAPEGKA